MDRLEALNKLQELYQKYEEQENAFCELIPDFFECGLVTSHNALVDFLIDQFAEYNEIPIDALSWHIYDNRWGKEGFEVVDNESFLRSLYV